jgi:NADP-dependent 3-hydroxy acid dehydrogenase YdfG
MLALKNKIVLITGASSGIGAACAAQFAQSGAKLLLCARRTAPIIELAGKLQQQYDTASHVFELDIRDAAAVSTAWQSLPDAWKAVAVLVNNAGLAAGLDNLQEGNIQDWDEMIDTNVKGLLYVTRIVLSGMTARNAGHIINIGSVAGHTVYPKGAVYCATKHAVNAISDGLRMDLLGKNIRVSSVDPGAVETNFSLVRFKGDSARAASVYAGMQPLSAEDVADEVVYCATRPAHVNVSKILLMPTDQAAATMIARKDEAAS